MQKPNRHVTITFNVVIVAALCVIIVSSSNDSSSGSDAKPATEPVYLKTPPEFLKPCIWREPKSGACLARNIENILTNWKDGIPGLSGATSLEPFRVRRVRVAHNLDNINLQLVLRNMSTYGFSQAKITNSTINEDDYTFAFTVNMPKVLIDSAYRLKGNILLLNVDGKGTLRANMSNLQYLLAMRANLKQVDDEQFFNVTMVKTEVSRIGGFRIRLANLFGNNKELEDSAHELFNGAWRQIFEVLRPVLSQTYDTVLFSRFRKVFDYIPARYLFTNLP